MKTQQDTAISFTKRLVRVICIGAASIFVIYALGPSQSTQSSSQERKLKIKEFKDMPLEIKIKNLQSVKWHRDLEIEVKNISGKRIYFILAYLIFPDETPPDGEAGISLHYGKPDNIRIRRIADPNDEHLDPGEKYVFTLPEPEGSGFEVRHKQYPGRDENLLFYVALVSFGDGTGWELGDPRDKRKKASALETPDGQANAALKERPSTGTDQMPWPNLLHKPDWQSNYHSS
ncbi:MAG: hypothetical protein H7Z16_15995 [Pyrinomonadaceae bacterium]|nr:hypothetical protein [Pyrinomonadaceae bacterium]